MVVCRFFLEGYCKYGSRCRYEHSNYYDYNNYNTNPTAGRFSKDGTSILRSEVKINQSETQRTNYNEDTQSQGVKTGVSEVVQIAMRDILQLEKGNQWPLTSYSPVKEYGNIPGWNDHSPEELRWESYNASKNGTFSTCKQAIENLYKIAQQRRMEIKIKEKATSIIENQLHKGSDRAPETGNLQWAGQNNSSAFSNIPVTTNIPFGTVESPFLSNQSNAGVKGSFFGSNPPAFGSSGFGTTPASPSVFNSDTATFGPASLAHESASPAFGSTVDPFGSGSSMSDGKTSLFGTQTDTGPPTSFVFSLNNQTKSVEKVTSQNVFQSLQSKQIDSRDQNDNLVYSSLDALTPSELSAFESQTFSFGSIPLKPPPRNLCGF